MDAGTAAVLAGTITGIVTLIASFIGPWVREAVTAKRNREETRRRKLRDAIIGVIEAFGKLLRARQRGDGSALERHTEAAVAISRLGVLLVADEKPVEAVLGKALNAITIMRPEVAGIALTTVQQLLPGWFRDEIGAADIVAEYDRLIPVNAAEISSIADMAGVSAETARPKQ